MAPAEGTTAVTAVVAFGTAALTFSPGVITVVGVIIVTLERPEPLKLGLPTIVDRPLTPRAAALGTIGTSGAIAAVTGLLLSIVLLVLVVRTIGMMGLGVTDAPIG